MAAAHGPAATAESPAELTDGRAVMAGAPGAPAVMAQARAENFPVASLALPRRVRSHLLAVYGFARLVDDAGDEASGDRLALLDELEADLERVWAEEGSEGAGAAPRSDRAGATPRHPLIAGLKPTVAACGLPAGPFRRLIEANRRDQTVRRYRTYEELLDYCTLSANPVGELVLRIFGVATPERLALSNKVCTALQLTEHWQDVAEDYHRGRVYLPAEDRERFGVAEADLAARSAPPALRALMSFQVERARRLLGEGASLVWTLRGRSRFAVAAFVAGGQAALDALELADCDVLGESPRPTAARRAMHLLKTLLPPGG